MTRIFSISLPWNFSFCSIIIDCSFQRILLEIYQYSKRDMTELNFFHNVSFSSTERCLMNYLHPLVCKNDSFNDNNRFFRERKSGGVEKYFTYDIQMDQKREVFRQSFINVSHIWTLMGLPILFSSVPLDSSCQDT